MTKVICNECETVAHCLKNGCVPNTPTAKDFSVVEQPAQPQINCKAKRDNNGVCLHHNLHCGWPKCNEPEQPAPVAEPRKQEPVGYADKIAFESAMMVGKGCDVWPVKGDYEARTGRKLIALYTSPPTLSLVQRQARSADTWVGLTPDDIRQLEKETTVGGYHGDYCPAWDLVEATEAKLKEKNA